MKDTWKNNLGLKIGAVLFAVFLWWTVVNVDDPIQTGRYTTEVVLTNTEVVTNAGKSYQIAGNNKSIVVSVKARRKVLKKMKASDIVATADFREMDEQSQLVPIRIRIDAFEGEYQDATANPRNLQIKTEVTETKTFPIAVATIGDVQEGYVLDKTNTVASPKSIEISGPKSSLGRIERVVAKVDVSELSIDTTMKAELIYYDSADNIIDQSLLSSNCDKNGVTVEVKLLVTRQLNLRFDTSAITVAEGYVFNGIDVEPASIRVAGKKEKLSALAYLEIAKEALHKEGLTATEEVIVDISEYLPKDLILADEATSSVVVHINVEKAGAKSLMLPVRSVKVNNVSEKFDVAYEGNQTVELQFTGAQEVLRNLTIENVIATVDMAAYSTAGTYTVPVQVLDLPAQCSYIGGATMEITLKEKAD